MTTPKEPHQIRGYMLDISRDKVPTMDTLRALVCDLETLGFNQLQLYTEHTFGYPGHEVVWGLASPLLAEEIRSLDAHCREHRIELVPCINTMGHWERWLRHPEYFQFAECPYGWRRPDGHGMPYGSTLAPTKESLDLLDELMGAYLPLFASDKVNIGGDEPWELGIGRTRDRCEKEGRHAVYLDFLRKIITRAKQYKTTVMFWGDILLENPQLWEPSEPDTIALIWGYETGHPFEEQVLALEKQGQPCLLCPGTSAWNSLGGRLDNALQNISQAAACARRRATVGMLLTDWGDHGHHQPSLLSLPAIIAFAREGWQAEAPPVWAGYGDVSELLPLILQLGGLFRDFAFRPPNRLPLAQVLTTPTDALANVAAPITDTELDQAERRLGSIRTELDAKGLETLCAHEFSLTLRLLDHAVKRLQQDRRPNPSRWPTLRAEFCAMVGEFEALWLRRNRIGGLSESSARFRTALDSYPSHPARRPAWPPSA